MRLIQPRIKQRNLLVSHPSDVETNSSSSSKISPTVLIVIVVLAVIFFICGVLHLFVRYLVRKRNFSENSQSSRYPEMSGSESVQRQLQQLFNLHDSGLDQAFIDALPVFVYKEIKGLKEPFDCAVCLCEFSELDKLRLLPLCSHAFHIDCIDTWLLSNSTCPLCRGTLFTPGFSMENPIFDFDDSRLDEDGFSGSIRIGVSCGQKIDDSDEVASEKRMLPVRLGKFRSTNVEAKIDTNEVAEPSNSNLDARRCYSMGSFQYVVDDSELQVAFCPSSRDRPMKGSVQNWNSSTEGDFDAKKIDNRSKGESFSVSKIWLWPRKDKFANSADTHMVSSSTNINLPWTVRT
ncbi:RING-H2 finger protein ATL47 [Heracleum sosnowskyi]|uniref:RING-type E3 ubiquitin transferase n=1 Tax=Heracleum sosnowskyi TaxID=360622 RepID=A0AAD8I112_9APIA|nr:RING-H2 finger protein ATL47 [Heracleum sosnowskyi]